MSAERPTIRTFRFSRYISPLDMVEIALPALLATFLFVVVIFAVFLPAARTNLLEQKKQSLTRLVQTAIHILAYYNDRAESGEMTLVEAKQSAVQHLRIMRYGPDDKDYFWINDLHPVMIMHPYRPDLEGKDVSDFTDPRGKRIFVEFVEAAEKRGGGYVSYMWQWKDDSLRIVPKLSYVMLFKPWKWAVGTGVYIEDIRAETALIAKRSIYFSLLILMIILILSGYFIRQQIRETHRRRIAEKELQRYQNHLEELVETRTIELQEAHSKIKILGGFLPICSSCKKIRDDGGYWNQIEAYIQSHSEAEFSHSLCPECARKLYPDLKITGKKE